MFKPTRGPQKASYKVSGFNHLHLISFLKDYQDKLYTIGEEDSAFRIEMLIEYFRNDYQQDSELVFKSTQLGF